MPFRFVTVAMLLLAAAAPLGLAGRSRGAEPVQQAVLLLPPVEDDSLIAEDGGNEFAPVAAASYNQSSPQFLRSGGMIGNAARFQMPGWGPPPALRLQNDFTAFPEFDGGIIVVGEATALKIGGFIKGDLIKDYNAIDATDTFDTTTIPTSGPQRENARFHARHSRLSFDTRWRNNGDVVRAFVEGDFLGDTDSGDDAFRLRHAFGTIGRLTGGQTWTTFTDPSAVPQTLDPEGAVSNVNRRQGLVRWTQPVLVDSVTLALALEDPRISVEAPSTVQGQGRTQSPDFVARLRWEPEWGEFQWAVVARELGFQPVGESVITDEAWGFNFTGSMYVTEYLKGYYQITFGEGIGSYRGSPDVVATGPTTAAILPMFGWMVGTRVKWTDSLTSNVTYSRLDLDDVPGQDPGNLLGTTYVAVNLIANPYERVFWGVEYLHGIRDDVSGASGHANRVQMSLGYFLP